MSTPGDPPRDPRDGQSKMSMPRDTRGAQSQMITPTYTHEPLSDITNVSQMITPTYTREPLGDITNVIGMLKIFSYANLFIFSLFTGRTFSYF